MSITFEQLPQAVTQLSDRLDSIERLLLDLNSISGKEEDSLLTIKQTSELIKLSVPTIYALVSQSKIPVCKKGKRLYFSKQDLISWINTGRKKTVSEINNEAHSYLKATGRR